jgi:hypothetical protein
MTINPKPNLCPHFLTCCLEERPAKRNGLNLSMSWEKHWEKERLVSQKFKVDPIATVREGINKTNQDKFAVKVIRKDIVKGIFFKRLTNRINHSS